jgi:hypothetical protein
MIRITPLDGRGTIPPHSIGKDCPLRVTVMPTIGDGTGVRIGVEVSVGVPVALGVGVKVLRRVVAGVGVHAEVGVAIGMG